MKEKLKIREFITFPWLGILICIICENTEGFSTARKNFDRELRKKRVWR